MNKPTIKRTSSIISLFVLITAALWFQGCEVIYTSSIIMPKDMESISTEADKLKKDEYFNTMFDEFCAHKKFQIKPVTGLSPNNSSTNDVQTKRKMCSAQWFYAAHLENHQTEYKIELSLMQPWSLWGSGKQERFFCAETNDMFDYFKTSLTDAKATYKPYAKCPQVKVQ